MYFQGNVRRVIFYLWILFLNNANQVYCSYLGQQLCRQTFFHLKEPKEKNLFKEAVETRSENKKRKTPNVYQNKW